MSCGAWPLVCNIALVYSQTAYLYHRTALLLSCANRPGDKMEGDVTQGSAVEFEIS